MKTDVLLIENPEAIPLAVNLLKDGKLVAFPTDTVYGLGAIATKPQAIERLFVVKGRKSTKAIAVLLGNIDALSSVSIDLCEYTQRLASHFWPGPLTLVTHRHPSLPDILSPAPTIGVRMPNHTTTLSLLNLTGPLAVTSANLSGQPNSITAQEALEQLRGRIPLILDGGQTPGGAPSTVIDCTNPEPVVLRSGPISPSQLRAVLDQSRS